MLLYIKIITNICIPARFAAMSFGPIILVRPKYASDKGLLEHEKVHVHQFYRSLGLFGIPYHLSKRFRIKCEVEAYKQQLKFSPNATDVFARHLSTLYNADITFEDAKHLLTIG